PGEPRLRTVAEVRPGAVRGGHGDGGRAGERQAARDARPAEGRRPGGGAGRGAGRRAREPPPEWRAHPKSHPREGQAVEPRRGLSGKDAGESAVGTAHPRPPSKFQGYAAVPAPPGWRQRTRTTPNTIIHTGNR